MHRIGATLRLSFGLACLSASVLLAAQTCGLIPDTHGAALGRRSSLCETLAINCSMLASRNDVARMEENLQAVAKRNEDIVSAGIRRDNGRLVADVGDHGAHCEGRPEGSSSTESFMVVPIIAGKETWGVVELCFRPLTPSGLLGFLLNPLTKLVAFVGVCGLVAYFLYLRKMLQHLDPSKVVPDRVRAALDTLAEGLLVMDKDERVVLANKSFARSVGRSAQQLQGVHASKLPWTKANENTGASKPYPWQKAASELAPQTGIILGLSSGLSQAQTFMVNSTPIIGDDGKCRGVLASFGDVSELERNKTELSRMLGKLKKSRSEIKRQNEKLKILAMRDPLTGCLNRRTFMEAFETLWTSAKRHGHSLSCVMVDIDHFKSVNDQHGHGVGDLLLQKVASLLISALRDGDQVCRYGGEEFCFLLPHLDIEHAREAAERYRRLIESTKFNELHVTVSLGVSALDWGAKDPKELLEQADKGLYVAKRGGRNRVVTWNEVPSDFVMSESQASPTPPPHETDVHVQIPYQAVTALVSALSYRDADTAEHSRRVADLCVTSANGIMSVSDAYLLETAALLHDIGKIGVADSILLKPGPLTEKEWKLMRVHNRIGVEILRATFASQELAEIVLAHHAWYGGTPDNHKLPRGEQIPLRARILAIADAYDSIVSDRVYRKRRSQEEAFAELRRCAGTQFDPTLVERFIEAVSVPDRRVATDKTLVSKQTALKIGIQIEHLASTLDKRDVPGLAGLAGRIKNTAVKEGASEIAELAAELEKRATLDPNLLELFGLTHELMELCRFTQRAYLTDGKDDESCQREEATDKAGKAFITVG